MFSKILQAARKSVLVLSLVLCSGCLNTAYIASKDGMVDTRRSGQGTPFSVTTKEVFHVWGTKPPVLVVEVDRVVSEILGKEIKQITGLRITRHQTFLDGVLQTITLGLYNPRTLVIQGEYHDSGGSDGQSESDGSK